ncbi:MAG TPA: threonine synthase [Candidatus Dormibacteraeota bacterium]
MAPELARTGPRPAGVIARYAARLPLTASTPHITLNEGGTPLIEARSLTERLSLTSLHFKFEGLNPTGSFKDRGMVVAVARALEAGSQAIVCASTGNTSASAAAYAARFGLRAIVVVPSGRIATGKLLQAQIHGAKVLAIKGNFDRALEAVRELGERYSVTLVNSVNPDRIEGQKTAAFEVVEDLGDAPDVLCIPVGNAGNITAYWRGFVEFFDDGLCSRLPRLVGAQADGAAPLVRGHIVERPRTVASAIRIGNPASWEAAVAARDASEGLIDSVTDGEILTAQRTLAATEGIFAEPASAAALAILVKCRRDGRVAPGSRVVCVLTGNGLKDPEAAAKDLAPPVLVDEDAESIARLLKL